MRNKHNFYNQYRKKRASPNLLAVYAPNKMIEKKIRKATEKQLDEINNFFQFFNDVWVSNKGIKFNNYRNE